MSLAPVTVDNVGTLTFPTGVGPFPFLGTAAPDGWYLLKPGQGFQVEQIADYPALAGLVGNRWGGDGVTTFAMPQAGVFTRGPDGVHALWQLFGEDAHTLTLAEMPAHHHRQQVEAVGNPGGFAVTSNIDRNTNPVQGNLDTQDTGGGGAHNNVPKTLTTNLIVKA